MVTRRNILGITALGITSITGCLSGNNNDTPTNTTTDTTEITLKNNQTIAVTGINSHPKELLLQPEDTDGEMLYTIEPSTTLSPPTNNTTGFIVSASAAISKIFDENVLINRIHVFESADDADTTYTDLVNTKIGSTDEQLQSIDAEHTIGTMTNIDETYVIAKHENTLTSIQQSWREGTDSEKRSQLETYLSIVLDRIRS